jgi:hypothetical protein
MRGWGTPSRRFVSALALLMLLVLPSCTKRLKLVLMDDEADAGATTTLTPANQPPPTVPPPTGLGEDPGEGPDSPPTRGPSAAANPTAAKTAAAKTTYPATCAGVCEKTLRCMNAFSAVEQTNCIQSCKPNPTRFAQLNQMDCGTLITTLKNEGSASSSSGGGNARSSSGAPSNCGPDKCSTCVWDGSSCYSRVPPHLACDACCCRRGGPAPRWD